MAQGKELKNSETKKPVPGAPDPEMLRRLELLSKLEVLTMMREMGIVKKRRKNGQGKKE